jgi:hypothetical protein
MIGLATETSTPYQARGNKPPPNPGAVSGLTPDLYQKTPQPFLRPPFPENQHIIFFRLCKALHGLFFLFFRRFQNTGRDFKTSCPEFIALRA